MRFIDTNVFVYALLEPRSRNLSPEECTLLRQAQEIMKNVAAGEKVLCSVVHLSEFLNIIQRRQGVPSSCEALGALLNMKQILIAEVTAKNYELALAIAQETGVGLNDCLAAVLMASQDVNEIYSFDKDFDRIGVTRIK